MDSNFYLPGMTYELDCINLSLLKIIETFPELFYDDIKIKAIYGCFDNLIWNGGRAMIGDYSEEYAKSIISKYNNLKIPVRFTFTNTLLEEEHLLDENCNRLVQYADKNKMNEILINRQVLEDYLRQKYPDFKYIASTTKCERNIDEINKMIKKYDLVVIDYNDNKNYEFLNQIEDKTKIEILINAYCSPNCPYRKDHYNFLSKAQLGRKTTAEQYNFFAGCESTQKNFFQCLNNQNTLSREELDKYKELGFNNFKIEGRAINILNVVESYVYYLVKPQYKDIVRFFILKDLMDYMVFAIEELQENPTPR